MTGISNTSPNLFTRFVLPEAIIPPTAIFIVISPYIFWK